MSISIEDLKSQLSAAVDAVPAGMAEPLETLYSRDNKHHRLSSGTLPGSATRRVPPLRKRWIAVFVVGLAVCIVVLLALNIGRTTGQRTNALSGGNQQEVIFQLRSAGPATHGQLEDAANVLARRLRVGGITNATVVVSGKYIVITSKGQNSKFNGLSEELLAPGNLLLRPVLCAVPPYKASTGTALRTLPSTCPSANLLKAPYLYVNVNTQVPTASPAPWAALAGAPSTPAGDDSPSATVLLPAGEGSSFPGERLLLGPAGVTGLEVAHAQVLFDSPTWLVKLSLNARGSIKWDTLALRQFHAYVAVDFDGSVVSTPLTEPSQTSFSSFDGKVELSGGFTEASATDLAMDLDSGLLTVQLKVVLDDAIYPRQPTPTSTPTASPALFNPIALFPSRNGNGTTPTFRVPMRNWQILYNFTCSDGSEPYRITLLPEGRLVTSSAANKPDDGGESDFLESGAGTYRLQVDTPSTCSWSVSIYPWG